MWHLSGGAAVKFFLEKNDLNNLDFLPSTLLRQQTNNFNSNNNTAKKTTSFFFYYLSCANAKWRDMHVRVCAEAAGQSRPEERERGRTGLTSLFFNYYPPVFMCEECVCTGYSAHKPNNFKSGCCVVCAPSSSSSSSPRSAPCARKKKNPKAAERHLKRARPAPRDLSCRAS